MTREIPSKITAEHRSRKAIVYLRQSSARQVEQNLESQRLQYGMVDRARDLGFSEIETIDCDLGCSAGLGTKQRIGFDVLISAVARGEVGIVMSREVSRLSRTDKDWCHLPEVCQIFGTLIGDESQVYTHGVMNFQCQAHERFYFNAEEAEGKEKGGATRSLSLKLSINLQSKTLCALCFSALKKNVVNQELSLNTEKP